MISQDIRKSRLHPVKQELEQESALSKPIFVSSQKETIKAQLLTTLLKCTAKSFKVKNSFARLEFENSNSFQGWFDSDGFNGFGNYILAYGSSFKGTFERSISKGLGRLSYINGDIYEGNFLAGRPHGYGQYKARAFQYTGLFENGNTHGRGVLKTKLGKLEGVFDNGSICEGKSTNCDGIYIGTFNKLGSKKQGTFNFTNGNIYTGFWKENTFSGFGEYNWNSPGKRAMYIGYWKNGKCHGLGMLKFVQRLVFCQWLDGKKNGSGIIIASNGTCYSGINMFISDQYLESQSIRNCNKSQEFLAEVIDILSSHSNNDSLEEKLEQFHSRIEKLQKEFSISSSPVYPLWIPNYEVQQASATSDMELKHLQQVLIENYLAFENLYKTYTQPGDEFMNHIGLNLFYMDIFHEIRDVNVSKCLMFGYLYVNQCCFEDTRSSDLKNVVRFHLFFQHFVHCSKLLMENEKLMMEANKLKATFFGGLAMKVLYTLKMFESNNRPSFLVRKGLAFDYPNVLKLIRQLDEMFHGKRNCSGVFNYLRTKNIIEGDCNELKEVIEKLYNIKNPNELLCDTKYELSTLEQIEIIFETCELKLLNVVG